MSKVKFLSTIVVLVLMLLSTGSVFADDEEEEPALDLGIYSFTDQRLPGMTGADWQAFLFEMDGGNYGGGGTGGSGASAEKEKYCKQVDEFTEFLEGLFTGSATPITGTAASGYSIAQGAYDAFKTIIDAAYRDIFYYVYDGGVHPPGGYISVIDWQAASINWPVNSWTRGGPTIANGGLEHIFATWLKSVGLGNGTSVLTDPDPSTEC